MATVIRQADIGNLLSRRGHLRLYKHVAALETPRHSVLRFRNQECRPQLCHYLVGKQSTFGLRFRPRSICRCTALREQCRTVWEPRPVLRTEALGIVYEESRELGLEELELQPDDEGLFAPSIQDIAELMHLGLRAI